MNPENDEIERYRKLVQQLQTEALDKLHVAWAERDAFRAEAERLQVEIEVRNQISRLPEGSRLRTLERVMLDITEPSLKSRPALSAASASLPHRSTSCDEALAEQAPDKL